MAIQHLTGKLTVANLNPEGTNIHGLILVRRIPLTSELKSKYFNEKQAHYNYHLQTKNLRHKSCVPNHVTDIYRDTAGNLFVSTTTDPLFPI